MLEILHLHTDLANELHRVSTIDISMHWMPECLLRKSGVRGRIKRGSLDMHYFQDGEPQHSVDSADSNAVLRTAEPSEAIDVAGAFEGFLARFFIYEDNCSNHEVMLRELVASQRSLSSWPLYETSIEALTRSIRAIDHRRGSNKRAMMVSDVMSPIQQLTKYPLLFADLLQSTPMINCPVSLPR